MRIIMHRERGIFRWAVVWKHSGEIESFHLTANGAKKAIARRTKREREMTWRE